MSHEWTIEAQIKEVQREIDRRQADGYKNKRMTAADAAMTVGVMEAVLATLLRVQDHIERKRLKDAG